MRPPLTTLVLGCAAALSLTLLTVPVGAAPAVAAPSSTTGSDLTPSGTGTTARGLDLAPLHALGDADAADRVRLSVGVQSLDGAALTDGPVVVGSSEVYSSASLIKLALVTTVLRMVDRGELSLDQVVTVTSSDHVSGAGELAGYPTPYDATVAELAELAIAVSDNTASNVLAELVGLDAVDALVVDAGLEPMHMGRLFFSSGPRSERNVLDTASTVELMRATYEGDVLSPASRDLLLGWMPDGQSDTKLAPALPGVPLASKSGDTSSLSHDGAYLLEEGRETVLVVLSETRDGRLPTVAANPYLAEAARLVHGQVAAAPPAPTPTPAPSVAEATDDEEVAGVVLPEPGEGEGESSSTASPALSVALVGVVVALLLTVVALPARALVRRRRARG